MKAMILAAGKGERLAPMSHTVPKPLFPVVNLPVIRYNIEFLKHYGFKDIIINLYHLSKQIEQELGDGSVMGVNITYSYEEELWGTGGGLKQVENFFEGEEYFVVMNADILVDFDMEEALHFHQRHEATSTMVLSLDASVKKYGAVEIDETSMIRNIAGRIDDVRESERTSAVFTGIHIMTNKVFEYIPPNITSCINSYTYPKMIQNGERIMGYVMEGFWNDLGLPETYYTSNMLFLDRKLDFKHYDPMAHFTLKSEKNTAELACMGENVELSSEIVFHPPFVVGHNVKIGDKAVIGPHAIIGDNCQIGKNAQISESVIFPGTKVSNRQRINGIIMNKKHKMRVPTSADNTIILEKPEEKE